MTTQRCRYEHDDPTRMPHCCNPTCSMTDQEALVWMYEHQAITAYNTEVSPPQKRTFIPRLVRR